MNRSARRQLDRDLRKLMNTDGDRCSICLIEFLHNAKTFYGRAEGRAAVVGECCRPNLAVEVGAGFYVKGDYDVLNARSHPGSSTEVVIDDVPGAVDRLQRAVIGIDDLADSAAKRAGIIGKPHQVSLANNHWKADDAAWFQVHTDRSHRLRPLLPGELASFPQDMISPTLPADHEIQVVIRQIQPGQRARIPFGRNLQMPIPDIEPVIHAIFDAVSDRRGHSSIISVADVSAIAERYLRPKLPLC